MIDFYFIFDFIRKNFRWLFILGVIIGAIYFFWDNIEYLYDSQQGQRDFFTIIIKTDKI